MRDARLGAPFIHVDLTASLLLEAPGLAPTSNSYMWIDWRTAGQPVVLFDYDPSRGAQVRISVNVPTHSGLSDPLAHEMVLRG